MFYPEQQNVHNFIKAIEMSHQDGSECKAAKHHDLSSILGTYAGDNKLPSDFAMCAIVHSCAGHTQKHTHQIPEKCFDLLFCYYFVFKLPPHVEHGLWGKLNLCSQAKAIHN